VEQALLLMYLSRSNPFMESTSTKQRG